MDSLTQVVLGAAVGQAVMGRQLGRRAMLWGAVCGTLPDLDVLVPLGDPVADFTYHRSASHSVLVLTALTPLLAWLAMKCHPGTRELRHRWWLMIWLAFVTHILLDSHTVYGTQLLWPLSEYPVGWATIFIIDPLYTLPLLVGTLVVLVAGSGAPIARRANTLGLVLSCAYLAWSVGAKLVMQDQVRSALAGQGLPDAQVLVQAAPFNTLLWRFLAMDEDGYYEGYRSLLDGDAPLHANRYASDRALLQPIQEHWPVQRLAWFSKGFFGVDVRDGEVVMSDLRMGVEPDYVFRFVVAEVSNPHPRPVPARQVPPQRDLSRLGWMWDRIWTPTVEPPRR